MAANTTAGYIMDGVKHVLAAGTEHLANLTTICNSTEDHVGNSTNSSSGSSCDSFTPIRRNLIPFGLSVMYVVFVVTGISTNIVNMFTLRRLQRSTMNVYLMAIACFDILFCASLASSIVLLMVGYFYSYWYNAIHLYFWVILMHVTPGASIWITIVIAFDRLLKVSYPIKSKLWITNFRSKITVMVMLLVNVLARVPYLWLYQPMSGEIAPGEYVYWYSWAPLMQTEFGQAYLYTTTILFEYLPVAILVICNPLIVAALVKHRKKRVALFGDGCVGMTNSAKVQSHDSEQRMIMLLIGVCIQSIICNLPISITRFVWSNAPRSGIVFKNIANLLFIFDRCGNFFIYCITNPDFRRAMWKKAK